MLGLIQESPRVFILELTDQYLLELMGLKRDLKITFLNIYLFFEYIKQKGYMLRL